MYNYGISVTTLIRDFLLRAQVCDSRQAAQLAGRLERELRQEERLENEDGTAFVRTNGRSRSPTVRLSQLGFGSDVDERHPRAVDPISMTSRLDLCS